MKTPISQPTPPGPSTTQIENPDGTVTLWMLALDTMASGAGTPLPHQPVPPRDKPAKKKALSELLELSIF
jgi:hypothetical protein